MCGLCLLDIPGIKFNIYNFHSLVTLEFPPLSIVSFVTQVSTSSLKFTVLRLMTPFHKIKLLLLINLIIPVCIFQIINNIVSICAMQSIWHIFWRFSECIQIFKLVYQTRPPRARFFFPLLFCVMYGCILPRWRCNQS